MLEAKHRTGCLIDQSHAHNTIYGVDSCILSVVLYNIVSKLKGIDNIMEVKVRATLKSLSVDLTADSGPLLKAVISGTCACGLYCFVNVND